MNDHHNEIQNTIEQLRKSKYPSLSQELVKQILEIEINNQENRIEANRLISITLKKTWPGEA
ncbi:MAG: hypothetical protein GX285_06285 [Clostridiales bacterium]|nr:hypothetical protein [Clostridiales bacterium]